MNQGVKAVYITLLQDLNYNRNTSTLKLHRESDKINLQRGVRQGDNISPKPFTACLQDAISTTNFGRVCVSSTFDQFLPLRFYFVSKHPENVVRIAKFPYAAFGPLFAFHCPLFVTKNNNLGWNRHRRFATHRNMKVQRSRPTVLSARGQ